MNRGDFRRPPDFRSALHRAGGESSHNTIRVNKSVRRAEASTQNIVRAKLRHPRHNLVPADHLRLRQTQRVLQRLVGAQVIEMLICRGYKEIALRAVASRLPQSIVELRVELDGVHRHLDVGRGGKLGPHASHAFAGRALSLMALALKNQHVAAALFSEVPGDAGADDAAANDGDVCGFHDG